MRARRPQRDLAIALQAQAERAIRRARLTVSRSLVLGGSRELLDRDESTLVRRCAWCDRYEIGGVWTPARRLPRFLRTDERRVGGKELTHTICPTCFERSTRQGDGRYASGQ